MKLLLIFGIGSDKILAKNHHVMGTVTKVERCWWYKVNTKPIRLHGLDGSVFPHIITFEYTVDSIPYQGKLFIWVRYRCPQKGESIDVYYDPERPKQYACYDFPPVNTSISW